MGWTVFILIMMCELRRQAMAAVSSNSKLMRNLHGADTNVRAGTVRHEVHANGQTSRIQQPLAMSTLSPASRSRLSRRQQNGHRVAALTTAIVGSAGDMEVPDLQVDVLLSTTELPLTSLKPSRRQHDSHGVAAVTTAIVGSAAHMRVPDLQVELPLSTTDDVAAAANVVASEFAAFDTNQPIVAGTPARVSPEVPASPGGTTMSDQAEPVASSQNTENGDILGLALCVFLVCTIIVLCTFIVWKLHRLAVDSDVRPKVSSTYESRRRQRAEPEAGTMSISGPLNVAHDEFNSVRNTLSTESNNVVVTRTISSNISRGDSRLGLPIPSRKSEIGSQSALKYKGRRSRIGATSPKNADRLSAREDSSISPTNSRDVRGRGSRFGFMLPKSSTLRSREDDSLSPTHGRDMCEPISSIS